MDVTDVIQAEQHVLQLQQQQSALLKEILPQQVVERLLMQRSDLVNSGELVCWFPFSASAAVAFAVVKIRGRWWSTC
eukprot:1159264-Pelagomonas_calceolata.AAC.8